MPWSGFLTSKHLGMSFPGSGPEREGCKVGTDAETTDGFAGMRAPASPPSHLPTEADHPFRAPVLEDLRLFAGVKVFKENGRLHLFRAHHCGCS